MNSFNPELQLKNIEFTTKNKPKNLLNELIVFNFIIVLALKFKKINEDKTTCTTFYLNSKAEAVIHGADIYSIFKLIYSMVVTKKMKISGKWLRVD